MPPFFMSLCHPRRETDASVARKKEKFLPDAEKPSRLEGSFYCGGRPLPNAALTIRILSASLIKLRHCSQFGAAIHAYTVSKVRDQRGRHDVLPVLKRKLCPVFIGLEAEAHHILRHGKRCRNLSGRVRLQRKLDHRRSVLGAERVLKHQVQLLIRPYVRVSG